MIFIELKSSYKIKKELIQKAFLILLSGSTGRQTGKCYSISDFSDNP